MDFDFTPHQADSNIIMACHITGVFDVNRNITLDDDNFELVREWAESIAALNLQGIIFHNKFSAKTCIRHKNRNIKFIRINYNPQFNPNVYRYFVYNNFLHRYINYIKGVFVTDISDVTLVRDPFSDPYFIENPLSIFCGDEPKTLNNEWMLAHSAHLRKQISGFIEYEDKFGQQPLLNCGIIGGTAHLLLNFINKLSVIHQQNNCDNPTAFTGDMGAFNYLVRTQFNDHLKHGAPVNTIFKMYEDERLDCWFKHK